MKKKNYTAFKLSLLFILTTLGLQTIQLHAQTIINISPTNVTNGSGTIGPSSGYSKSSGDINLLAGTSVSNYGNGWIRFDLSVIPAGATINAVSIFYSASTASGTTYIKGYETTSGAASDPAVATGATLYNLCAANNSPWVNATGSSGNHTEVLGATAVSYIQTNFLTLPLLAISFASSATSIVQTTTLRGYNTSNSAQRPYLIVTYTAAPPCATPVDQPIGPINFSNITTSTINGLFAPAFSIPDGYLVVRYPSGSVPTNPVDGTIYAAGNSLGTGIVIQSSISNSFAASSLTGGTAYDFYAYAFNGTNSCSYAYNTNTPLMSSQATASCVPVQQPISFILTPALTQIDGSFTAASQAPTGYLVVRYPAGSSTTSPVNGTGYNPGDILGAGTVVSASNTNSFSSTNLSPGTPYDFYAYSFNNGNGCNNIYNTSLPLFGSAQTIFCSGPANAAKMIPGDYPTLAAAFADLQLSGISGPVVLELQSSYTNESPTGTITVNNNVCFTPTNTLTIRPAAGANGLVISSSAAAPTIDLSGVQNVIIDGIPGGSAGGGSISVAAAGSDNTINLNIKNTNTSGVAIRITNDASNNTIKYCDLQGQNTNGSLPAAVSGNNFSNSNIGGVVFIGSFNNGTNGNDDNIIDHCNIHSTGALLPKAGVCAFGPNNIALDGKYNDNNTISYCNIYDVFSVNANSAGIELDCGNNAWTILGNSFFQTSTRTFTGATTYRAIWVTPDRTNPGGNGFVINGNYIGGTQPNCGGTALTMTSGTNATTFEGMNLSFRGSNPTAVNANTITNISFTATSQTGDPFHAMWVNSNGNIDIGTTGGNTIGTNTGTGGSTTGGITIQGAASSSNHMIIVANGSGGNPTVNIKNNSVGNITLPANGAKFSGIFVNQNAMAVIDNNLIGSLSTSNSINASSTSTTAVSIIGINIPSGSPNVIVSNNTIANINSANTSTGTTASQIMGIGISAGGTVSTTIAIPAILNNTIRNFSNSSNNTATAASSAVMGICLNTTNATACTISGNTLHSLKSTAATANVSVEGIYFNGSNSVTNNVSKNFVHSYDVATTGTGATLTGININAGKTDVVNNMVRLGIKPDGNSITTALIIRGIRKGTTNNNNFYFNSVCIGGTGVDATATNSFAFMKSSSGTDDMRNNIFVNIRSNNAGGGKHYALSLNNTTGLTINNNVYQTDGSGGVFAVNNSADAGTYTSGWTSGDNNSFAANPQFINASGDASSVNLHINPSAPTPVESNGIAIAGVTDDIDGQNRSAFSPTDIGADAGNFTMIALAIKLIDFTGEKNTDKNILRWQTTKENNNVVFDIEHSRDGIFFEKLGVVTGKENTDSYSYVDTKPVNGINYYRLKIAETSGAYIYSHVLPISNNTKEHFVSVYPNPVDELLHVTLSGAISGAAILTITDITGKTIRIEKLKNARQEINMRDLQAGIYFLKYSDGIQTEIIKINKQ